MKGTGLKACSLKCMSTQKACKKSDCRHHIDFPEEYNCVLVTVFQNGNLTLRQTAERLGISFARVKQIEKKALLKLKKSDLAD
tara:strand:+ start:513 stop:761 length:249 start_codon:yes stop_codon:yes gene_type:complete